MATSSGIGSTVLDVNSIVSQLMSVEQRPLIALGKKEAGFQAKLSAIGSIKGALASFQNAVKGLSDVSKFQAVRVTPADATIATASSSAGAIPGTYGLEISKLAQAQKLVATGQDSTNGVIGSGVLSFDFGSIAGTLDAGGKYVAGATFT